MEISEVVEKMPARSGSSAEVKLLNYETVEWQMGKNAYHYGNLWKSEINVSYVTTAPFHDP